MFIVFEGTDGSGKSTQIKLLYEELCRAGYDVELTKEPTDGSMGKLLRSYLKGENKADPKAIAALFAADRLDHITAEGGILDLCAKGKVVLCDRYYLSSYAYQSLDCDLDWITELNRYAAQLAKPDLHIFLDLPAELSMQRVKSRGETELFECLEEQKKIRDNFYAVFERVKDSENLLIIDATKDIDSIAEEIRQRVAQIIK